jgi:hypothetical protein
MGVPKPRRPAPVLWARVEAARSRPARPATRSGDGSAAANSRRKAGARPVVSFQLVVDKDTSKSDLERMLREVEGAMARFERGEE